MVPGEWGMIAISMSIVLLFLYFFLFGLDLLGRYFGHSVPSIVIDHQLLVVPLVVARSVSVNQGISMIMGANIDTPTTTTTLFNNDNNNEKRLQSQTRL